MDEEEDIDMDDLPLVELDKSTLKADRSREQITFSIPSVAELLEQRARERECELQLEQLLQRSRDDNLAAATSHGDSSGTDADGELAPMLAAINELNVGAEHSRFEAYSAPSAAELWAALTPHLPPPASALQAEMSAPPPDVVMQAETSAPPPAVRLQAGMSSSPPVVTMQVEMSAPPPAATLQAGMSSSPSAVTMQVEMSAPPPASALQAEINAPPPAVAMQAGMSSSPPAVTMQAGMSSSPPAVTMQVEMSAPPPASALQAEKSSPPPATALQAALSAPRPGAAAVLASAVDAMAGSMEAEPGEWESDELLYAGALLSVALLADESRCERAAARAMHRLLDDHASADQVSALTDVLLAALPDANARLQLSDALRSGGGEGADRVAAVLTGAALLQQLHAPSSHSNPTSLDDIVRALVTWRTCSAQQRNLCVQLLGRVLAAAPPDSLPAHRERLVAYLSRKPTDSDDALSDKVQVSVAVAKLKLLFFTKNMIRRLAFPH